MKSLSALCLLFSAGAFVLSASPSSVTVASSSNPVGLGQSVTFTATVTPAAATGKVTFYDGVTVLGAKTVSGGVASISTALLLSGGHSVTAYYAGDASYSPSTSSPLSQAVNPTASAGLIPGGTLTTSIYAYSVAAGDFNGDGKADLVFSNDSTPGGVTVLLGNGNGTFHLPSTYSTGFYSYSVAVGDFDGDGRTDVVAVDAGKQTINVLLSNADGTLKPATSYSTCASPYYAAVADFNRDGKADVAVACYSDHAVGILLGNGDGTFQPFTKMDLGSGTWPYPIATADFNGDGIADIVTGNWGGNSFSILLGHGDGTFQLVAGQATQSPHFIATGDFNGDGRRDLAIVDLYDGQVNIFLGKGDGTFQSAVSYATPGAPVSVVSADINGDGKADLAIANNGANSVTILLGNGNGTFQSASTLTTVAYPFTLAAADFNADGRTDLAVASSNKNAALLLGTPVLAPALSVTKTHSANFKQGQNGATYTITAGNAGTGPTTAAVTVTESLPSGLTLVSMAGTGWTCTGSACSRSDTLAAGATFPPITVTVNVAGGAPSSVTNQVTVASAGLTSVSASDVTAVALNTNIALALTSSANPANFGAPVNLTATISSSAATGKIAFFDGSVAIGTATASGGVATLTTSLLSAGSHSLRAYYLGDATYPPVSSPFTSQSIAATGAASLLALETFSVYLNPIFVATADFNGDGKTDIAVANKGGNNVSVLLGQGDGTFQQPGGVLQTGPAPTFVLAGDFNGDGKTDLAVAHSAGIDVYLGNGDGTFLPATTFAAGTTPYALAVADFNGDGRPDLAVANNGSNTIGVLLGNGDGTFQNAVSYSVGGGPVSLAVADFNGDGIADIAVANNLSNNISVLKGNVDGTFQAQVQYAMTGKPTYVIAADFNGDGKMDLVAANSTGNAVSILLGNGNATFQAAVNYACGNGPNALALGDFNGDGKLDLAVANLSGKNASVLLGNGSGVFQAPIYYALQTGPASVATADFNADGKTDLVAIDGGVSVLLGGSPVLTITKTHPFAFTQSQAGATYTVLVANNSAGPANGAVTVTETIPSGLSLVSMSGAGWTCSGNTCTRSDSLVAGASYPPITVTVNVSAGAPASVVNQATVSGGGAVSATASDPTTIAAPSSVALTSSANPSTYGVALTFTAAVTPSSATGAVTFYDGVALLGTAPISGGQAILNTILPTSGTHRVKAYYRGSAVTPPSSSAVVVQTVNAVPAVTLIPGTNAIAGANPNAAASGDFNGDGKSDLAVANGDATVSILLGKGDGTFLAAVNYPVGAAPGSIATGDFNGDGKTDLVVANYGAGTISILLGNGNGTFQIGTSFYTLNNPTFVAVGDFNGDGKADLAICHLNYSAFSVHLGNGDGTFQPEVYYATASESSFLTIADFNGDGKADVAVSNDNANFVSVFLGNGDGTFPAAVNYPLANVSFGIAAADFNADGKPDLAVANGNAVSVLINKGDGTFQAAVTYATDVAANALIAADLNGDGKVDLALTNVIGTDFSVLLGNGDGTFQAAVNRPAGSHPISITSADLNGDGRADVIVVNPYNNNLLTFLGANPALSIAKTHAISFVRGQQGTYTVTVSNSGLAATVGTVTVTENLPAGLTLVSMAGSGWTCSAGACTRSDALNPAASYPAITVVTSVAANAPNSVTNQAIVSGGSSGSASASDVTTVVNSIATTLTLTSTANPSQYGGQFSLVATVSPSTAAGKVTFYDGVNVLGIVPLSAGHANFVTALLNSGAHAVKAFYTGDPYYAPATSSVLTQTIIPVAAATFYAASSTPVGSGPGFVATGDFNGDGNADVAVANTSSATVGILLGKGDGTFLTPVNYAVDLNPHAIAVGDFNGDGKADLAVTTPGGVDVGILLGKGDGTFFSAVNYPTGTGPFSIVTGDFNGDGKTDLAIANFVGNNVSVLLGKGDGTFQTAVNYAAGTASYWIASADLNGDGKADLVVANRDSNNVSVLLGNGDGTFQTAVNYPAGAQAISVAVGDFNGDGKPDVAALNADGNLNVLLGNGDGTLQAAVTYAIGGIPGSVNVADLNGDGKLDLAIGMYGPSVLAMLGNGDGTFQTPVSYVVAGGAFPISTAFADFNGDGKLDIATANQNNNTVSVLFGAQTLGIAKTHTGSFVRGQQGTYAITVNNTGTALTSGTVTVADQLPSGMTLASMTGTGWTCTGASCSRSDLLGPGGSYQPITVVVNVSGTAAGSLLNNATVSGGGAAPNFASDSTVIAANVAATVTLAPSANPSMLGSALTLTATVTPSQATGKVTFYDGQLVLGIGAIAAGKATLSTTQLPAGTHALKAYYSGDASDSSATSAIVTETITSKTATGFVPYVFSAVGTGPNSAAAGDFNGDGKADLAVANTSSGTVSVLLGYGSGSFQNAVNYATGTNPRSVATGDFNGDGKMDLVTANAGSNNVSVLLGNGNGTFQAAVNTAAGSAPYFVVVGDFNRDGKADIAVADYNGGVVSVLLGNGDGTLQTAVTYAVGTQPDAIALGDFNGDGKTDLAVANWGSNNVSVLLGNGNGTFQPAVNYAAGTQPNSVAAGDLTADGKTDLAVANFGGGNVSVLAGNGDGTFQAAANYATAASPAAVAIGDLNGDALPDLAVAITGGSVAVFAGKIDGTLLPAATTPTGATPIAFAFGDFNADGRPDMAVVSQTGNRLSILLGGAPSLSIGKMHNGVFWLGEIGATYTVTVYNLSNAPTVGTVTVTDTPPIGMTITSMAGSGWTCGAGVCSRQDPLSGGNYPPITVTVNIAANAAASLTNQATVSGGGSPANSTSDTVAISPIPPATVTLASSANPATLSSPVTFTATLSPTGATGKITFYDGVTLLGTSIVAAGKAALPGTLLQSGTHSIKATYAGDANYLTNVSNVVTQTVNALAANMLVAGATLTGFDGPSSIAMGDFNGDGIADLATANTVGGIVGGTVGVALGNGNGTFRATVNYAAGGSSPRSIATGDFNGDGKLDVAVVISNGVTILLGNGDGTFQAPGPILSAGATPFAVAVGDFNADGKADLAVADSTGNAAQILLGNGDGSFQSAVAYAISGVSNGPQAIAVADVNNDGIADVAVVNYWSSDVNVFIGNGDGTFQFPFTVSIGIIGNAAALSSLAFADLDGDGNLDLVVISPALGTVNVVMGPGFFQNTTYTVGNVQSVAIADWNGDGKPDIAVTTASGVSVLFNNGGGTFGAPVAYTAGASPAGLVAGDFNRDGRTDLAVANQNDSTVSILLGAGATLAISKTHVGNFTQGQTGATYSITVSNPGTAATVGAITVTETAPTGLTLVSMAGSGWTCPAGGNTCTRSDALSGGATYPPIAVTVNVAANAPASVVNQATVSGGGAVSATASDTTTIGGGVTIAATSGGGQTALTGVAFSAPLQATVTDAANHPIAGTTVTFSAPATGASAVFAGGVNTALTNAAGVASIGVTANSTAGTYAVTATAAGAASPASFTLTNAAPVNTPPSADSVSPNTGSATTQTFTFKYSSVNGAAYLSDVNALINADLNGTNACWFYYLSSSNKLFLYRDDATGTVTGSLTPGAAGTLSNTQCTISAPSAVTSSGNTLTVPVTVAFSANFTGARTIYGYANDNAGAGSGWRSLGTWTTGTNQPPVVTSITPVNGSGSPQLFTVVYSDPNGFADLSNVHLLFNSSLSGINGCWVYYVRSTNQIYLYKDDLSGTVTGFLTPGGTGTLSNSQCTVASGGVVTGSGANLSLPLNLTFSGSFVNAKSIYGYANDNEGSGSGWTSLGSWTTGSNQAPTVVSVTPVNGSGSSQTFTAVYSDPNGFSDLNNVHLLFNTSLSGVNGCWVYYLRPTNQIYLYNDDLSGAVSGFLTPGGTGTLSNSQCTVASAGVVTGLGNNLSVPLNITFAGSFVNAKSIYGYANDNEALGSGWKSLGSWTTGSNQSPTVVSLTPVNGSGSPQTFTAVYSDPNGFADLNNVHLLFNTSLSGVNGCWIFYLRQTNQLYLYNDDLSGTANGFLTPGGSGTISNSQCTVASAGVVTGSGNNLSLPLTLTFSGSFVNAKSVYGYANDNEAAGSGWKTLGSWTTGSNQPPSAVSVSPPNGSGSTQIFTATYSDPNGSADLSNVHLLINSSLSGSSACWIYYVRQTNQIYLYKDDLSGTVAGFLTPGSGGTLANSQCTVASAGVVTSSGNSLSVPLSITFAGAFAGPKTIYGYANDNEAAGSGWLSLGAWTVQ